MREWLSGLFQSTLSRLLAYALSGFFTAFLVLLFGGRLADLLQSEVQVNLGLILILVLFSLIGLAAGVERILENLGEPRAGDIKLDVGRVAEAQRLLLETLARVESQPSLSSGTESELRAELLFRVDQWELVLVPVIGEEEIQRIRTMRDHIQNQSLKYAKEEGADWTRIVKDITAIAQSGGSR